MSKSGLISGMVLILNIEYGKCPKNLNTIPYFLFCQHFAFMQMFLKIISGMANSVDPDQTAPKKEQPDLGLHCLHVTLVYSILGQVL